MSKHWNTISISLYLIIILVVLGILSLIPKAPVLETQKKSKIYDLSTFDFEHNIQVFGINKLWESWAESLYTPQDFIDGAPLNPSQILSSKDYTQIQYATHRLSLILPPDKTYGISMKSCDYSMRIYIDDKEIGNVGIPGITKETTTPRTDERVYYFTPQNENVDILLQVSNFVHNDGAQPSKIYISSFQNITQKIKSDSLKSFIIIGCLLTSGLYHLGLFLLNRKRKTILIFSICCFLLLFLNNKLIPIFFPKYNWYVAFHIEYIIHFTTFGMLTLLLDYMFPNLLYKWVTRIYYIICGFFILITFIFSTVTYSGLLKYFDMLSILMIVYILIRLAMALKDGKTQNIITFIGVFALAIFGVNDILSHNNIDFVGNVLNQVFTTTVGMVFFVFCFAIVLSVEYAEIELAMLNAQLKKQSLANDNAALDRINQMKNDLIAIVSHETRTPLAVMSGYAELISMEMKRKGVDTQTAADLDKIAEQIQRIAGIMDEMKNFSHHKNNYLHKTWIQLKDIIDQVTFLYTPILMRKNTELVVNIECNLPRFFGNADELTQVIFNLLQNARNYTEDGKITVDVQCIASIVDEVNITDQVLKVTISDTGTGISPELLPYVFEKHISSNPGGTGLGLSICKDIIEGHSGNIWIENNINNGTVVTFVLPVKKDDKNAKIKNK